MSSKENNFALIHAIARREHERQNETINLIASENLPSKAVMQAAGSIFMDKYSEGYPGKRYYGGCANVDDMESLCKQLWLEFFCTRDNRVEEYSANVQVSSGTQANQAVYLAVLNPGDTILALDLNAGGHLSHASPHNLVGKLYNIETYNVDPETELIDYDSVEEIAMRIKPQMIVAGASSYSRFIDYGRFHKIAKACGSYLLVDLAHVAGFITDPEFVNPFLYGDFVTTTTHKILRGPRSALIFCRKEFESRINRAVFPGMLGGCQQNMVYAKAVCAAEELEPSYAGYVASVKESAARMAKVFIDAGCHVISGGTDSHLFVANVLENFGIDGAAAQENLESIGICLNKQVVPFDKSVVRPSGIRIGTPFLMTRGGSIELAEEIASLTVRALQEMAAGTFEMDRSMLRNQVLSLTRQLSPVD